MKILIGTPVHKSKDKLIKKWLNNVAQLMYQANLLIVDSSPDTGYLKKLDEYSKKNKLKNYQIMHLMINQQQGEDEKNSRSREIIRQEVLSEGYHAWFSWECNQSIPPNTLDKLVEIMKAGNFAIVSHIADNKYSEQPTIEPNGNLSCSLISKKSLMNFGFLLKYPNMPDCWHGGEIWFKKQVIKSGGKYIEVNVENTNKVTKYRNKKGLKLNLGCGDKHKKGYLNIDILKPCDLKHNLTKPWPFDNDSVSEIFSEGNTICLFSQKEWKSVKKEMARVLKISGKLELIFFDLEYIFKAFLKNKEGERWDYWWRTIFSAQKDKFDYSKNGFTYKKIVSDLTEEGFTGFKKLKSPEPGYIHLVCYKYKKP